MTCQFLCLLSVHSPTPVLDCTKMTATALQVSKYVYRVDMHAPQRVAKKLPNEQSLTCTLVQLAAVILPLLHMLGAGRSVSLISDS